MPKLPGDSSLVGCIQKITKNKPWVFKKRTLSLKHKPRAISYHLMNKPTIVKKQKCEWKNISNPHTSLWKKSVTFTFVVAGTSISALCSVLADGRKKENNKAVSWMCLLSRLHFNCRPVRGWAGAQQSKHYFICTWKWMSHLIWLQQVWYTQHSSL